MEPPRRPFTNGWPLHYSIGYVKLGTEYVRLCDIKLADIYTLGNEMFQNWGQQLLLSFMSYQPCQINQGTYQLYVLHKSHMYPLIGEIYCKTGRDNMYEKIRDALAMSHHLPELSAKFFVNPETTITPT